MIFIYIFLFCIKVVECLLKYLMTDFQCWDQLAQLIPAESPLVRAKHLLHPLVGAIELNQYPIVKLLVGCLIDIHASYRNGDSAMSMTTEKVYCCAHKCFEFSAPVIFKVNLGYCKVVVSYTSKFFYSVYTFFLDFR